MNENPGGKPPFLPFMIVDVLFLGMAAAILTLAHRPLLWWEACLMVACGAAAAWSITTPILRHDGYEQAVAQSSRLAEVTAELKKLEQLVIHVHAATVQWKMFELQSSQSLESAKQLSQSFATESRAFAEMLQKANESEKSYLRLEVEKFRRNEGEWLQTLTRILDHIFGLVQAAQRTGQRPLIEQLTLFQDTCRDAARRIGLAPVMPRAGDPFDPRSHQLLDNATAPEKSVVSEIIATGFTYQGQLVRRALVGINGALEQNNLALAEKAQP